MVYESSEEECPGQDTKVELCSELACCNSEMDRESSKRCTIRCTDVRNPPTNPAPDFYESKECMNKCKCKVGYALADDGKRCVKEDLCRDCIFEGKVYKNGEA